MIKVDMDKAKEIHRDSIRQAREEAFKSLDVQFIRAVETNDKALMNKIAQTKQELRDATDHPQLVNSKTPDQLKAFWPESLNTPNNPVTE